MCLIQCVLPIVLCGSASICPRRKNSTFSGLCRSIACPLLHSLVALFGSSRGGDPGHSLPIYGTLSALSIVPVGTRTVRQIHPESSEKCGAREDALYRGGSGNLVEG